ncbi:MAG: hypothetical protein HQM10_15370 [Candidatus Riflebacteria bacterium]|nr:hypothetical protein [Candidatus Riflebacteria bacterium]
MISENKDQIVNVFFAVIFVVSVVLLYNVNSKNRELSSQISGSTEADKNDMTPLGVPSKTVVMKRRAAIKEAERKGVSTYTFEVELPPPPIMAK